VARVDELRQGIDAIDDQIVELLEQRAKLASDIGKEKASVDGAMHDPERERAVLARLEQRHAGLATQAFPNSSIRPIFREIMSACLSVETSISVAYLGPSGTFSHMAARSAFGLAAHYVEAQSIPAVFDLVLRKGAEYGIVPIENSTEGGVNLTLDCFLDYDIKIRGELVLEIAQCLVGRQSDLTKIQRVYSHPQPLAQCRKWLSEHLPMAQLVVSSSTSAAARQALEDESSAAVASALAAELNDLQILRHNIQDRAQNATRFVILHDSEAPPSGRDRTTLLFGAPHERGALRRILEIFDGEGVNLTRIESRPGRGKLWEYVFFCDLEGHQKDAPVAAALARLTQTSAMVRVLGSYPRAT
jgi:chorismate mutase / prephenate dehydratase